MTGYIRLVAAREIRERTRGRIFRVGTVIILGAVAAAIVIPVLQSSGSNVEKVGVFGPLPAQYRGAIVSAASASHLKVELVREQSTDHADQDLRAGRVDLVIVDSRKIVVAKAISPGDTSVTAQLARIVSSVVGLEAAIAEAHLSPRQADLVTHPLPLPVTSLQPAPANRGPRGTSLLAVILVFVLLSQYATWTLMGVAEEKSSRVVEVLLSAIRPIQLLAGKVLGIGVVALAQAGAIVAFALVLAKAVGSNVLTGAAPLEIISSLAWLILGYSFYCWVYAAAGSLAERQDQLQSLSFPLTIPMLLGYLTSLTAVVSGSPSTFVKVLAYLPPTAPFAMPVLVGLGKVAWWQFAVSAALSIIATFAVARLAADVYRRAILRTGRGVRLREVLGGTPKQPVRLGRRNPG